MHASPAEVMYIIPPATSINKAMEPATLNTHFKTFPTKTEKSLVAIGFLIVILATALAFVAITNNGNSAR